MSAPQLHEVLAVEKDLRGQANTIVVETAKRFSSPDWWNGGVTSFHAFFDEDKHLETDQHVEVDVTVEDRLAYTAKAVAKYWDAVLQKEATNQVAKADIVIGEVTVAKDVPATMLLGLEEKLDQFRKAISNMPTLDLKSAWQPAEGQKQGIFETVHEDVRFKTRKVIEPVVLYEATDHHPAQVEKVSKDVNIGKYVTRRFSGAVTSARKAEILGRVEQMSRAVKKARQRANKAELVKAKIGSAIFNFILG